MDKTQQAAQLRLAADILETGHPWHLYRSGLLYDATPVFTPISYLARVNGPRGYEIRLVLATPPDGRSLHNPDNLTAEQVGAGWRLTLKGEKPHEKAEMWFSNGNKWCGPGRFSRYSNRCTYRVPFSVPWPEPADPYADLKKAHAEGKVIEGYQATRDVWEECPLPAWTAPVNHYRIKPDTSTFQLPPPPPGMQWHRTDGWQEGDLPEGWRPLALGELVIEGDEVRIGGKWMKDRADVKSRLHSQHCRTRTGRPLTFTHECKTWTWHRPGDPMPCDGEMRVACVFVDHDVWDDKLLCAHEVNWGDDAGQGCIIGWRYADEKKTVPLGPEDVKPFTVIRRKGEAQTWHWRTVSYVDAVKVTCGNRVYGWDELASSYERNESLPLTGKWNPSAWEPCSKPA